MSKSPNVRVEFDTAKLMNRFKMNEKKAHAILDTQVMKDTDKFVRFRTGMLARSVQLATTIGSGKVIYDTPYAQRAYYSEDSYVTKDVHPKATAKWLEHSKEENMKTWTDIVRKILREGN